MLYKYSYFKETLKKPNRFKISTFSNMLFLHSAKQRSAYFTYAIASSSCKVPGYTHFCRTQDGGGAPPPPHSHVVQIFIF